MGAVTLPFWTRRGGVGSMTKAVRSLAVHLGLNVFKQFCVSFYFCIQIAWWIWVLQDFLSFSCHLKYLLWYLPLHGIKFLRIIQMSWLSVTKSTNPVMTRTATWTVKFLEEFLWLATGSLSRPLTHFKSCESLNFNSNKTDFLSG